MADGGLCVGLNLDGTQVYQSARFMPGIFEFVFMRGTATDRDKRIAVLIQDYEKAFVAKSGELAPGVSPYRVITVDRTVQAESRVHTYDQVHAMIEKQTEIAVSTCYCRHAAFLRDEDTHQMPNDVCMQFGIGAKVAVQRLGARKITKDEAMVILQRAEDAGLIHMSMNITEDADYLCNCDRWHCNAVKTALSKPRPALFFNSGFEPYFDADLCVACETCLDRCPAEALVMGDDDRPLVDLDRCFGCAVCATGCPSEAITMTNKPGYQPPPENRKALKEALKASRGYA
jgi:Pyruvate/2-oxoacid:ferredoxin oxidoreductase delta subunit